MAYTTINFVPGEVLTATKMNLLAANDASFADGSGFANKSITPDKIDYTNWPTPAWEDITGFLTGWSADTGADYNKPQIAKDFSGQVRLRGVVRYAAGAGAQIFILPTEYRPSKIVVVPAVNGNGTCVLYLRSDGQVRKAGGLNDYVSLDGVSYYP